MKTKLFPLFLCLSMCSCSNYKFDSYGELSAEIVQGICESHALRIHGNKEKGQFYSIYEVLGIFRYDMTFVTILKYDEPGIEFITVIEHEELHGRFICELNDPSYSVDVWIKGNGSYDLTTAYDRGLISDDEVEQIIRYRK